MPQTVPKNFLFEVMSLFMTMMLKNGGKDTAFFHSNPVELAEFFTSFLPLFRCVSNVGGLFINPSAFAGPSFLLAPFHLVSAEMKKTFLFL